MKDRDVLDQASKLIADTEVTSTEEWDGLRKSVRELADTADHPQAIMANVGQALAWKKPDEPGLDGDEDRSDEELSEAAQQLIDDARDELDEAKLSPERFEALKSEIELLCIEAEDEEAVRSSVADQLAALDPA